MHIILQIIRKPSVKYVNLMSSSLDRYYNLEINFIAQNEDVPHKKIVATILLHDYITLMVD